MYMYAKDISKVWLVYTEWLMWQSNARKQGNMGWIEIDRSVLSVLSPIK